MAATLMGSKGARGSVLGLGAEGHASPPPLRRLREGGCWGAGKGCTGYRPGAARGEMRHGSGAVPVAMLAACPAQRRPARQQLSGAGALWRRLGWYVVRRSRSPD